MPIEKMLERVEVARTDSDTEMFNRLMYFGEMLTKITAAGLVAAISDDRDGHRYRQLYRLVRADSIGTWSQVIVEVLNQPIATRLLPQAAEEVRQLSQKSKEDSWQYRATALLDECLDTVDEHLSLADTSREKLPKVLRGHRWFSWSSSPLRRAASPCFRWEA